ncbi:MAG: hypothetical protein WCD16_08470 [Paracoccaceae bacterium]
MTQFISRASLAFAAALGFLAMGQQAVAQQDSGLFGKRVASVTYGRYVRLEFGVASPSPDNGFWRPPGYPADPKINFDLNGGDTGFGAVAMGFDWMNGFRGDISLTMTGNSDISGPCSSASDGSPCDTGGSDNHADISDASVRTTAVMGNLFYSPLEQQGSNSVFQPFLVAGLGIANNHVGRWTRENDSLGAGGVTRTFKGASNTDLAWSLGLGASWQVTRPGKWPVIVEASWRYYDFGMAEGGATPVGGSGGTPVQPLTFDHRDQVFSIGVRVPLQRF